MSKYSDKKKTVVFCSHCAQVGRAIIATNLVILAGRPQWVCTDHKEQK